MPQKLASAVDMLGGKNNNQPLLYCSALKYVDVNLKDIGCSKVKLQPSFGNALVENIVTGCTSVFNRKLRTLITQYRPHGAVIHDWYFSSIFSLLRRRVGVVLSRETIISSLQVSEFNRYYLERLDSEKQMLIRCFLQRKENKWSRWLLVSSAGISKQTVLDTIAVKALMLLGWY